jgi:chlorobactene glucosyltransferase
VIVWYLLAAIASLPWLLFGSALIRRAANSTTLDDESADIPPDPPLVSVIVPARNEARNIEDCLRSILTTTYPIEVIVADDDSADGTGAIAARIAAEDTRVRVIRTEQLPPGWLGKPWACHSAALMAHGSILCFTDADTRHSSDGVLRVVNAMARRNADLLSVYTGQRLGSIWERMVQPQVFTMITLRFGGTETVTASKRAVDKIANGQCLFVRKEAYDELDGHARVRAFPTEDIGLAQSFFSNGRNVVLTNGSSQFTTRMYESLGELVGGWRRSLYAGGRNSMPPGPIGSIVHPIALILPPVLQLAPLVVLLSALALDVPRPAIVWAVLSMAGLIRWWLVVYGDYEHRITYALLHPVAALIVLYICVTAIFRGRHISWKGREFVSG